MTCEELVKLLTDIRDFTTLRCKSSVWSLDLATRELGFFRCSFLHMNRLLKGVSYLLIFVIQENKICISAVL